MPDATKITNRMKRQSDAGIFSTGGVKSRRTNRARSGCQRAPESSIREDTICPRGIGAHIMKAAVFHSPNQPLTIEQVDIDDPQDHEVLVRTAASGVCHSDLHFVEGLYPLPGPAILGHEAAGVVEKARIARRRSEARTTSRGYRKTATRFVNSPISRPTRKKCCCMRTRW